MTVKVKMCHTFCRKPVVPRSISAPRIIFPSVLVIAATARCNSYRVRSGVGVGSGVELVSPILYHLLCLYELYYQS